MSLAASFQNVTPAPALLFTRATNFYCDTKDSRRQIDESDCPAVYEPFAKCSKDYTRSGCEKACKLLGDEDKLVKENLKCAKKLCTNYEDDFEKKKKDLKEYLLSEMEPSFRPFCEQVEWIKPKKSSAVVVRGWKGASVVAVLALGSLFMF
ncbi:hypothetical protein BJ508DRAFT_382139 [Ascobolus immersus RN42]|uniref:Uncharacterized protein n=1 Tax=Ascobolus immersus RN42 TaxID=1160509 RepID=A0A3N4H8X6_ASCIM|nr:hypothetical protein BJ508DRAFT_382139 [Ascobolus immersus RN42]